MPRPKAGRISRQSFVPFVALAVCLAGALGLSLADASAAGAANGSSTQQSGRQAAPHGAGHEARAARGSSLLTARAAGALQPAAPLSFETVRHVSRPGCDLLVTLNGFGYDPQNRPALGWTESSGCGGGGVYRWSRLESNVWAERTITAPGCCGGIRGAADFELRQDGTPFYAYAYPDAFIFGGTWFTAHFVDLNAQANGHGTQLQPIESYQSCISAYPSFAIDFAPGASSPNVLLGTRCAETGWLTLNGQTIHGSPPFRSPAGQNGEYYNLDYAAGPDGSHHATYFSSRGAAGRGAYYSNGSPGNETLLAVPHLNRGAETSVAAGADGRIHVAIGGVPLCDNVREGGLLYLTSMDGVNWTRTFVDRVSGRSPSLELDSAGRPRIAYYHLNEVRFASLDGGLWTTATLFQSAAPVKAVSVKLAYDPNDQPHVLFFDQTAADAGDIRVASGSPSDQPPSAVNPGDQTGHPGSAASLQINASDAEGGALTYSACGLPPGLSIDPSTGLISGTISSSASTNNPYDVNVFVTDPAGNSAAVAFQWTLADNAPPALANPGDQTNAEGDNVSLQLAAADPDGDALTFSAAGLPPGLSVNPATGLVTGTLGFDAAGGYGVSVVVVEDGHGGAASAAFNWVVTNVNRSPTALSFGQMLPEDTPQPLTLSGVDPDGDALTFTVTAQPAYGTLSGDGASLTYTPAPNYNGPDAFAYTASDGALTSEEATVSLVVTPVADAPVLASVGDQTVAEGALLMFTLTGSDPDGDTLTYSSSALPAGASLDASSGVFSWTPDFDQSGSYTVTFTVADPSGLSASETVTITVTDVVTNRGPVCSGAYPSVAEIWPPNHKATFPLEILGVTDPDGDGVAVRVTSVLQDEPTDTNGDGSTWVDGGGVGTASPWVRAERAGTPKVPGNGRVYEIFFDASDGRGNSCTGSVKVGVPHDQGSRRVLVDDGKRYDSTVAGGACLNCR